MNPAGISEEIGKQVGGFMEIMKHNPLSLALVLINLVLLAYLFYSGTGVLTQRKETVDLIVAWQRETEKLMASCVSAEIMKMVLEALERRPPPLPQPRPREEPKQQSIEIESEILRT